MNNNNHQKGDCFKLSQRFPAATLGVGDGGDCDGITMDVKTTQTLWKAQSEEEGSWSECLHRIHAARLYGRTGAAWELQ